MGVFDVVFASAVRQAVLLELAAASRQRRALVEDVDASKSAVYDALNELREHGLVREGRMRRWETTTLGDLVAHNVDARERTGDVLSTHADYWTTHDPSGLPPPFRDSLGALTGCEHLSAPDAEPFRVVGDVVDVIEGADRVDLVAPIYHDRYAAALESAAAPDADAAAADGGTDTAGSQTNGSGETSRRGETGRRDESRRTGERSGAADVRLLLAPNVLRDVDGRDAADWDADNPTVRVGDPGFSLIVTDEAILLALPREDGTYDVDGKLRVDTDRARDWAQRLFEHEWRRATSLAEHPALDG